MLYLAMCLASITCVSGLDWERNQHLYLSFQRTIILPYACCPYIYIRQVLLWPHDFKAIICNSELFILKGIQHLKITG